MSEKNKSQIDPEINNLLGRYRESRSKLETYSSNVESLLDKVSSLFPTTLDYKNRFILEEKIKTSSNFYNTLLSLRQEINKTYMSEIEMRRKLQGGDEDENAQVDIRKIAEEVENSMKQRDKEAKKEESEQINKDTQQ